MALALSIAYLNATAEEALELRSSSKQEADAAQALVSLSQNQVRKFAMTRNSEGAVVLSLTENDQDILGSLPQNTLGRITELASEIFTAAVEKQKIPLKTLVLSGPCKDLPPNVLEHILERFSGSFRRSTSGNKKYGGGYILFYTIRRDLGKWNQSLDRKIKINLRTRDPIPSYMKPRKN